MQKRLVVLIFAIFVISVGNVSSEYNYTYTGTIHENGDDKWQSNEINFITFELGANQVFEVQASSFGDLEVMFCDCDSYNDVEDILRDLYDGYDPKELYFWMDTYSVTTQEFTPSQNMRAKLAIFSYDSYNPSSMEYTIQTNIAKYTPPPPSPNDNSGSSSDGGYVGVIILLIVVAGIGIIIVRDRNKRKKAARAGQFPPRHTPTQNYFQPQRVQQQNYGYDQPHYTQKNQNVHFRPQEEQKMEPEYNPQNTVVAKACDVCGKKVTSKFCVECGTRVN